MATLRELVATYQDLLLFQYRTKVRARGMIGTLVSQMIGNQILRPQLEDAFDVDSAIGAQLDIIGKYVGLPRTIGDPIARPYYSFSSYDGTVRDNGFIRYGDAAVNAQAIWYSYLFNGAENTALTDDAYRLMLKLKIILNSNDGTLASIQEYLHTFLPGVVALVDNKDMTLTYTLSNRTPVSPNVLKAYLPKPMGVGLIFVTLSASYPTPNTKNLNVAHGDHSLHSVQTDLQVVSVTNGVGPFTYLWVYVSGATEITPLPTTDPSAASRRFLLQGVAPVSKSAVWRCIVTDARGIVAYTNDVAVTLTITELP